MIAAGSVTDGIGKKPDITVTLKNILQEYPAPGGGTTRVIDGVSVDFSKPGINMLLGPSGCGKSTLLHMMGGVRPMGVKTPTSGTILIDGVECDGPHDDSVMVFQRYANRPDLTVFENVAFPFRLKLWKKKVPDAESRWFGRQAETATGTTVRWAESASGSGAGIGSATSHTSNGRTLWCAGRPDARRNAAPAH